MQQLIRRACDALHNSYAPYSRFFVAAALQTVQGEIFTGCNVENASYPAGICAERAALSAAVSAGFRAFSAIAVVGGKEGVLTQFCPPCGVCLQMLSEFASQDFTVLLYDGRQEKTLPFWQLLPQGFSAHDLKGEE